MVLLKRYSFWNKVASYFLIAAGSGHYIGHYVSYEDESQFSVGRLELAKRMQAYISSGPLPVSMWTMLQMFSLSFGLLFILGGLTSLVLIRPDLPLSSAERLMKFNCIFWGTSFAIFLIHPVIQPLVISAVASLLYGYAWWQVKTVSQT